MGISARPASRIAFRISRPGVRLALVGAALVGLVLLVLVGYRAAYRDRIYPGVSVGGSPVGGMSRVQAESTLTDRLSASLNVPVTVDVDGRSWELSRPSLGARYDESELIQQAFAVGRTGSVLDQLVTPALVAIHPVNLDATVLQGGADWVTILRPIAQAVNRPAVDAKLTVATDRTVHVIPDQPGARLDVAAARTAIAAALTTESTAPVTLAPVPVAPLVRASDLADAQVQASIALSDPISVVYDGRTWTLSADQIQKALLLPRLDDGGKLKPTEIDPVTLSRFVKDTAEEVDRNGQNARLVLNDGAVTIAPSRTSRTLDQAATAALIRSAMFSTDRSVTAVVKEAPPSVVEADLISDAALANKVVGAPVVLSGPEGRTWTVDVATLQKMLSLGADQGGTPVQTPRLDSTKLKDYIATVAQSVDRPASNARFQYNAGQVTLLRDGTNGYQLDQQATVDLIQRAAVGDERTVSLPVKSVSPAFSGQDASALAGLQLIGQNSTSYVGSIPPRKHNVELATSMLNGVVVAPGQVFSFNQELGPQTLDRGFQVGYGIVAQANGGVKTVPSVGGGICQVSTTLFQPIFWAGYEIEERHWHAYWIAHYASHGYPGLDDTVDDASGLDFQFKNTTEHPLLIQSSTDGSQVHFSVYGVPPAWTVHVDEPVVTNVVKTDRQLQIQEDPTLPPGRQIYTEAAEDGFTVTIHRTVDEGDGNVRNLTLRSVYAPSHNVMAVGPKA